jgi:hypothetical protein
MVPVHGSYVGNGSAQAISGLGFAPAVVFIKGGTNIAVWRTSTMAADSAKPAIGATAFTTGIITSLDADGFTVGSDAKVNANATTYHYLALPADAADTKVGSYTGNNQVAQAITGVGFQPDVVIVLGASTRNAYIKTDTMSATNSKSFSGSLDAVGITAIGADGFTVGTSANTNGGTETFHYIALKQATGLLKTVSHTGTGSSQDVTGLGLTPATIFIVQGASVAVVFRGGLQTGDAAYQVDTTNTSTTRITGTASGQFTVGTSSTTNNATGPVVYHDIAIASALPAVGGISSRLWRPSRLKGLVA